MNSVEYEYEHIKTKSPLVVNQNRLLALKNEMGSHGWEFYANDVAPTGWFSTHMFFFCKRSSDHAEFGTGPGTDANIHNFS